MGKFLTEREDLEMNAWDVFSRPEVVWFLIGLILLVLELAMPGLIIAFFGVGAWIVTIVCLLFDISLNMQLLIFIAVSLACLLLLRGYIQDRFFDRKTDLADSLEEEFIGKTATVVADIKAGKQGKVSFKGTQWSAVSDSHISKGKQVKIISKDSIVLRVEPIMKKNP
jgi:membrane protein implicated in regulation of membrane protease activity